MEVIVFISGCNKITTGNVFLTTNLAKLILQALSAFSQGINCCLPEVRCVSCP